MFDAIGATMRHLLVVVNVWYKSFFRYADTAPDWTLILPYYCVQCQDISPILVCLPTADRNQWMSSPWYRTGTVMPFDCTCSTETVGHMLYEEWIHWGLAPFITMFWWGYIWPCQHNHWTHQDWLVHNSNTIIRKNEPALAGYISGWGYIWHPNYADP